MDAKAIGRRIDVARKVAGIENQSELARLIGMSRGRVSQYLTGTRLLMPDAAAKICDATGCDFNWLYGGDPACLTGIVPNEKPRRGGRGSHRRP
jgi:transcriptional regulator with XRE-family HTH domain